MKCNAVNRTYSIKIEPKEKRDFFVMFTYVYREPRKAWQLQGIFTAKKNRVKYQLKLFFVKLIGENGIKEEEKNILSGQIEPLASLTVHLLCFRQNGSLPSDNKNHG